MPAMKVTAKRFAAACVTGLLTINAYAACASAPEYEGGGRTIDNGAAAAGGSSSTPDAASPDTFVPKVDASALPDVANKG